MKEDVASPLCITTLDIQLQDEIYGSTPKLRKEITEKLARINIASDINLTEKLKQLMEYYPSVPILKHHLMVAYNKRKQYELASNITTELANKHSEYFNAIINVLDKHILDSKLRTIAERSDERMILNMSEPQLIALTLDDVLCYYKIAIAKLDYGFDLAKARKKLKAVKEISPNHPFVKEAQKLYDIAYAHDNFDEDDDDKMCSTIQCRIVEATSYSEEPIFTHKQIKHLYRYGFNIPHKILTEIINLPHHSLAADLELVLEDCQKRYGFYSRKKYREKEYAMLVHAIMLLTEIKATESLEKVLQHFECDNDFQDFWDQNFDIEYRWKCIYVLGRNNTELLKQFLLKPGVDEFSRTNILNALKNIVLVEPHRREEIKKIYTELLDYYIKASPSDNLDDSNYYGFFIYSILCCDFKELQPGIKKLFKRVYIAPSIIGKYKQVEILLANSLIKPPILKIKNIFEAYSEHSPY